MNRSSRTVKWAALLMVSGMALSACSGNDDEGSGTNASDSVARQEAQDFQDETEAQEQIQQSFDALPGRPAGVVTIDGASGSLTSDARRAYTRESGVSLNQDGNGEDRGFDRLCAGEIDLVDSSRAISQAEWEACQANGLDVVQFQIAADAVVLAIKAETDVGGDCLSTAQVRDIFRAGSPVQNWADQPVGLLQKQLTAGGPTAENNAFGFFGTEVLESEEPSLVDFRGDYQAFASDQGARFFVYGNIDDRDAGLSVDARESRRDALRDRLAGAQQVLDDALAEQKEARRQKIKGERDDRPPADKARDTQRVIDANLAASIAQDRFDRINERFKRVRKRYLEAFRAANRFDDAEGNVAFFRFPYYGAYEDQLRPFEITLPDGQIDCIFPSQRTIINGEYPFARQLLITTTVRSLDRAEVKNFLEDYLNRASTLADRAGLVQLPDQNIDTQIEWVNSDDPPVLGAPDGGEAAQPQSETEVEPEPQDQTEDQPIR